MKRTTATWTMTMTAAVLLAVPTVSVAQTAMQPPAATQPAPPAASTTGQPGTAQEHLRQARASLNDITATGMAARSKAQIAEVKRRLTTLEKTSSNKGSVWATEVAAIDKILTTLLGTPGAGASPAVKGKAATTVTLDETSRAKLTDVRTAITAYAGAMSGQPAAPPADAAATTSTPMPTDPSVPAAQAAAPPPPATAQTTVRKDDEGARRHLTEARATLTGLTQLPAAAQLSGDARTQVSQLISNFNELITTQSDWRAAYAKVEANLTALLGPDTGAAGTAPAMDPAVRAKLIEMRKNLTDFERAAGGGAATAATPATPASPGTPTSPATPASPAVPATPGAPAAHADAMTHIAAIDAMLKTPAAGGGLTLDKAQADMLRTHLAELKKLLAQAK